MSWRIFENVFKLIGRTQFGKHRISDGIPDNLLISSIYTFYSTVNVPDGHTIILCEFEELRSNASQKRHNLVDTESSAEHSADFFFHVSEDLCPRI